MNKQNIYLFPEIVQNNEKYTLFKGAELDRYNPGPVEVSGFAVYTFINRLDEVGFPFYAVCIESPNKTAYLYRHTFPNTNTTFKFFKDDFKEIQTEAGTIICLQPTIFDSLSEKESSVRIKGGDWEKVSNCYNNIAALHHLGIIQELSPPVFSMTNVDRWAENLHQSFGTNGTVDEALIQIFNRMKFAGKIFNITAIDLALQDLNPKNTYCFGRLNQALENSMELDVIRYILPISQQTQSKFYLINQFLLIICDALNTDLNQREKEMLRIQSVDDFNHFEAAMTSFQRKNNLPLTSCDIETLKKLSYISNFRIIEPLPVFLMAGINVSYEQIMDFKTMKPISFDNQIDKNSIEGRTLNEVNKTISSMADPTEKIESMNKQIMDSVHKSNLRCAELSRQVQDIDDKVIKMAGMLKDAIQESQAATNRVKIASKTLNSVYDAHKRIQGKFEVLKDRLFSEQRNTRIILFIGIFLSLLGALELIRR